MALGNCTEFEVNDVYRRMLKESKRKVILEGSDNDLIHAEIEEILNDFKSKISVEGTEEKIRDVEKYPTLTAAEKSIIKSIQKVLDALDDLGKVEYSGIITMVGKQKSSDSEAELEQKDKEFAENQDKEKTEDTQTPEDDFKFESKGVNVFKSMLTEATVSYSKSESDLIKDGVEQGSTYEKIAKQLNRKFHKGETVRTVEGVRKQAKKLGCNTKACDEKCK